MRGEGGLWEWVRLCVWERSHSLPSSSPQSLCACVLSLVGAAALDLHIDEVSLEVTRSIIFLRRDPVFAVSSTRPEPSWTLFSPLSLSLYLQLTNTLHKLVDGRDARERPRFPSSLTLSPPPPPHALSLSLYSSETFRVHGPALVPWGGSVYVPLFGISCPPSHA